MVTTKFSILCKIQDNQRVFYYSETTTCHEVKLGWVRLVYSKLATYDVARIIGKYE